MTTDALIDLEAELLEADNAIVAACRLQDAAVLRLPKADRLAMEQAARDRLGLTPFDQALDAAHALYDAAYEKIATTPATSLAGIAVKVRLLVEALALDLGPTNLDDTVARTVLEDINRLAARAAS